MSTGRGREHHLTVERTARYWTLGEAAGAREVWIVLHGYKQLARRFLRRFEAIDAPGRLIVAPEALSRFYVSAESGRHGGASVVGATWMTREDREAEIRDYVAYLDRLADHVRGQAEPEAVINVLGFSQGVATATRWVTAGRVSPERLVLWGDFTPPDLDLDRAQKALSSVAVDFVRGDTDRALSPKLAEEEVARLEGAGIEYRTVRYAGGHDIDQQTLVKLVSRPKR